MSSIYTKEYVQTNYPNLTCIEVGIHTYGPVDIYEWGEGARLTIGKYCSIAKDVKIFLGGNHRPDWVTTYPFSVLWSEGEGIVGHPATKGDVTIGNDVWIGQSATIMSGITIGSGAVIGSNAVITKDVPPYAIVVGNPSRVVKYRFNAEIIAKLLQIAWWDWPEERIRKSLKNLCSDRIESFVSEYLAICG